jgi:hypothetical protein
MAGPDYGSVSTQTSALYTMLRTAQAARGRVTQLEAGTGEIKTRQGNIRWLLRVHVGTFDDLAVHADLTCRFMNIFATTALNRLILLVKKLIILNRIPSPSKLFTRE